MKMEWPNEKVVELINIYRDRPSLWDSRVSDYRDRQKRQAAILEIANHFGTHSGEIERKIKNLISNFLREIKKERQDKSFKSKWHCYNNMLFLKERNQSKGTKDSQAQETSDDMQEETQPEFHNADEIEHSDASMESGERTFTSSLKQPQLQMKKNHKKISSTHKALAIMHNLQQRRTFKDQYSAFGESVGMRIRDLSSNHAKKVVKHLIGTILFEAEMGKYDNPTLVLPMYSNPYLQLPNSQLLNSSSSVPGFIPNFSAHHQKPSNSNIKPSNSQSRKSKKRCNSPVNSMNDSESNESMLSDE